MASLSSKQLEAVKGGLAEILKRIEEAASADTEPVSDQPKEKKNGN